MKRTYNSYNIYGLLGQAEGVEYDNFLCLGKKCKRRKKERHEARMARKRAKTDARKADTERVRAETQILQQTAKTSDTPSPLSTSIRMPLTQQSITPPKAMAFSETVKEENTEDFNSNKIIFGVAGAIGVLLVGGYLFQMVKKNQSVSPQENATITV